MSEKRQITVVTSIPSPYQVELFNAIAKHGALSLSVVYDRNQDSTRPWPSQDLQHQACFLDRGDKQQARILIKATQLAVFSGYRIPEIQRLMELRHNQQSPWAFWGERPGFQFPGVLGQLQRRWPMRLIHASRAPIWGIGQWAVEGYRQELDDPGRLYLNVPYFSDLGRYSTVAKDRFRFGRCKFLFSGQLIKRKGVDLLVAAFARLVREEFPVELHLLGDGPMREELQQAVKGYSQQVFFHGYQPWQSLPQYYRDADFLCVPSRHDGWALVVPEGLAAGLPVIASDRTGAARQLLNSANGWLIPADDASALYVAMKQAIECLPAHYQQLSHQARETAVQQDLDAGIACFRHAVDKTLEYWSDPGR